MSPRPAAIPATGITTSEGIGGNTFSANISSATARYFPRSMSSSIQSELIARARRAPHHLTATPVVIVHAWLDSAELNMN
jgi:hypothetical protein